ncbi:MAG: carboxypeptidase-like regulatory domain-containing protein [Candidatus Velthaea sp.]
MKRSGFFFASLLAVGMAACSSPIAPQQNYATVSGRVYDAATNVGIPNVTVTALIVNSTLTGPDGAYTITNVPSGQGEVQVTAPAGYGQPPPYPIAVQAGEHFTLNIPLTKS